MPLIPPNRITVFPLKDPLQWYDPEVVFRPFDDIFGRGVIGSTDLQVIANGTPDSQISVKAGRGYVPYTSGGKRYFATAVDIRSDAAEFLRSVGSYTGTPRVDRVVAKVKDATITPGDTDKGGVFDVIPGTPTAGANLTNLSGAASVPTDSLLLGNVLVNDSTVSTGDIDSSFGVVRAKATIGGGNSPAAIQFAKGGVDLTQRPKLNFIEGTGITITPADDAANNKTDLTFTNAYTPELKKLFSYTVSGSSKAAIDTYSDNANTLLPTTYKTLIVRGFVHGSSSGEDELLYMLINNDSGANYDNDLFSIEDAGAQPPVWSTLNATQGDTQMAVANLNLTNRTHRWTAFELKIIDYSYTGAGSPAGDNIAFATVIIDGFHSINATTKGKRAMGGGIYRKAASTAITRLAFTPATSSFWVGSMIEVWGM